MKSLRLNSGMQALCMYWTCSTQGRYETKFEILYSLNQMKIQLTITGVNSGQ